MLTFPLKLGSGNNLKTLKLFPYFSSFLRTKPDSAGRVVWLRACLWERCVYAFTVGDAQVKEY